MKWTKLSNGNLFADTGPATRYWIVYRGDSFRLEYLTKKLPSDEWIELGQYDKPSIAKGIATKRENSL